MKALIDKYSKKEFEQIVLNSSSFNEVAKKLGYSAYSGSLLSRIRKRVREEEISTEHFKTAVLTERNENNIFIENSTANQSTLRRWYIKNNYTDYICSICGQEPVWQGKELTLILDHINGFNHDDRLENLRWVCPNCNMQLDTTNGKNIKKLKKHNYCANCGKEIGLKSVHCAVCASKLQPRKVENRPSREELKEMIRTSSFVSIGKCYGVTDNTIRKWCDSYNLPRKASDIKQYSDEEWEMI